MVVFSNQQKKTERFDEESNHRTLLSEFGLVRTKPVNDAEKWPPNGTTEQLLGDDSQLLLTSHRISYTGQGHYREVVTN